MILPEFRRNQRTLLRLANTEAGRFLIGGLGQKVEHKIVRITQNSFIEHVEKNIYRATFFSRMPLAHIFLPTLEEIKIANEYRHIDDLYDAFLFYQGLKNSHKYPHIMLLSSTFNPASGANSPIDGTADRSASESFSSMRGGSGTTSSGTASNSYSWYIGASSVSNQFAYCSRSFYLFDTSTLTAAANISAATFSTYITAKTDGLTTSVSLVNATIAANNAIANSDYQGTVNATTKQASDKTISSVSTSAYLDWALNATGLSGISKTGITKYGGRNSTDVDNSAPSWVNGLFSGLQNNFADNGSNVPKLVVTYTLAGGMLGSSEI